MTFLPPIGQGTVGQFPGECSCIFFNPQFPPLPTPRPDNLDFITGLVLGLLPSEKSGMESS